MPRTKPAKARKASAPAPELPPIQEPDYRTIYQKIADGDYEVKGESPGGKPKKPEILSKPAGELTDDELANLATIRSEYVNALTKNDAEWKARRDADQELESKFYRDLMDDFGLDLNCPFCQRLYSLAYERGHSGGYSEVTGCLADLLPLYEEAKKMVERAVKGVNSASTNPAAMDK